jgi:alginate O-acetyltransferase complex protein AlgI
MPVVPCSRRNAAMPSDNWPVENCLMAARAAAIASQNRSMIFTTYWFLAFALGVVALYWLLPRPAWRLWFLAAACVVFHGHFAGPAGVAPIVVLMVITYFAGLSRKPWACVAGIVASVAALAFYKYTLFLIGAAVEPWQPYWAFDLRNATHAVMPDAPPLAVSFFAFEFVHYLYEVKKGGEPIRSPLKFVLFSIFFPSLVAGPIKRYQQFIPALEEGSRTFHPDDLAEGLRRIGIGFFKKVVIADNLTIWIDIYQPQFDSLGIFSRWLVVAAIAFRILMDFSGYSDIAIGFARLLGVKLPENFNWPYLARNLQDFWQRWHISLSSWIRDYVYIPLGGSRHGPVRRVVNGLIAFGLCGLWHGPAWHFVVWGIYHGVGLALCATYRQIPGVGPAVARIFEREPNAALVLTQLYAWLGWLVFFYPVPEALRMARGLIGA